MASIKDVARLAAVSVSTVSRVLSASPRVDAGTRRRVERAMARCNYRPNLLAQGLRSKRGNLFGLVVPKIFDEVYSLLIEHVERCSVARGYDLIVGNTGGEPELEEAFIEKLFQRHVDGIIFSRVSDRSRAVRKVARRNVPMVMLDRTLEHEDVPAVVLDNYRAGVLAAEHLAARGHRDVAEITGPWEITLARERHRGFADAARLHGMRLPASHVLEGDFGIATGQQAARAVLARRLRITGLWCQNDLMAAGAMTVFQANGVRIPEDLSIVGMDDNSVGRVMTPPLTTVIQPFAEMCRQAVESLVALQKGGALEEPRVVLPPTLLVRGSVAPPARARRLTKAGGATAAGLAARRPRAFL